MTLDTYKKDLIKEEILDKYDLYDIINLLGWDLDMVYDSLEELILDELRELDLECLNPPSEDW